MLRKILLILSGNAAASIFLFARNLAVAALIPVEDYGIAVTFAVTMALVEMSTQFGLQQQIVQDRDGEDRHFQSVLQGFQLARGLVAGALLFALAGPLATFLRIPEVAWAYQVMAVMPVLRSLQHFDIHRLNRSMRYGPMILTGVVPAVVSLMAVYPLAMWLGDYRVMLFALVLQEILGCVTSQIVAERRFRLAWDSAIIGRVLNFGWPLLLNGMVLFLVMQGDKVIVGRELGMVDLAIFGMGVTLTLTPTLILAKSTQNFFLPQLSAMAARQDPEFDAMARAALQAGLLNGLILILSCFVVGIPLIRLLLADEFAPLEPLLIWLAVQQGVGVFKSGASAVALSRAATVNMLIANLIRITALPIAWIVVRDGGTIWHVVAISAVAEAAGYGVALWLLRWRLGLALAAMGPALAISAGIVVLVLLVPGAGMPGAGTFTVIGIGVVATGLALAAMADLRRYVRTHILMRPLGKTL